MFYSQFILAKKGPLGTIWIAAHLERKLRKNQITETNISASVDSILFPEVPIALRLSGHLLLGVVRIYSRKVNYLFHDCSEALIKIKQAFHSSSVDLPPEASTAPFHSITLPETLDFDDVNRENVLQAAIRGGVDHHVTARDLITLRDQTDDRAYHASLFTLDERFPESGDPYSVLDYNDEELAHEKLWVQTGFAPLIQEICGPTLEEDVLPPLRMDDEMDLDRMDIDKPDEVGTPLLFEKMEAGEHDAMPPMNRMDLDDSLGPLAVPITALITEQPLTTPTSDAPASTEDHVTSKPMPVSEGGLAEVTIDTLKEVPDVEKLRSAIEYREQEPLFMELEKELDMGKVVLDDSRHQKEDIEADEVRIHGAEATPILREPPTPSGPSPFTVRSFGDIPGDDDLLATILGGRTPVLKMMGSPSETLASAQPKRGRRKRKSIFDDKVVLSSIFMKKQLANVDDLRRIRRKTPLTECEAWRLQELHNEQKFARPSVPGLCADLRGLYNQTMKLPAAKLFEELTPHEVPSKLQIHCGEGEGLANDNWMPVADDISPALDAGSLLNPHLQPAQGDANLAKYDAEVQTLVTTQEAQFLDSSLGKAQNLAHGSDEIQTSRVLIDDLQDDAFDHPLAVEQLEAPNIIELIINTEQLVVANQVSQEKEIAQSEPERGAEIQAPSKASARQQELVGLGRVVEDNAESESMREAEIQAPSKALAREQELVGLGRVVDDSAGSKSMREAEFQEETQSAGPLPAEAASEHDFKSLVFLEDPKDTVFLAPDEEEILEEADVHNKRGKLIQDNSGWSSRTKAVAQYLKATFEKLEPTCKLQTHQPAKLSLDRLLRGRTRKEAARMFFETLVLKTKDYIHVEQKTGLASIDLSATHFLMKELF